MSAPEPTIGAVSAGMARRDPGTIAFMQKTIGECIDTEEWQGEISFDFEFLSTCSVADKQIDKLLRFVEFVKLTAEGFHYPTLARVKLAGLYYKSAGDRAYFIPGTSVLLLSDIDINEVPPDDVGVLVKQRDDKTILVSVGRFGDQLAEFLVVTHPATHSQNISE